MKRLITLIMVCTLFIGLSSCLKDTGNYDYKDINELTIDGIDESKEIDLYSFVDTLVLEAHIEGKLSSDPSRFKFEWKVMPFMGDNTADSIDHTIGVERKLVYPVSLDPGSYKGYLNVTDVVEGIRYSKTFKLLVRSIASEGYVVLSEHEGRARLDMISPSTESDYRVAYDIWNNEEFDYGIPQSLFYNYNTSGKSMTLYVSDKGTFRLDKNLKASDRDNISWLFGSKPDNFQLRATSASTFRSGLREILINDEGALWARNNPALNSIFEYPINSINGTEEVQLSPHIGMIIPNALSSFFPSNPSIMLYDQSNKQFLELRNGSQFPTVMSFQNYNLFPVRTGREIVHAASTLNRYTFAILKEPNQNRYYVYGMTLGDNNVNSQEYYFELKLANQEEIKNFAIHPTLPYIYYSTRNKVYQFDYSQTNSTAKQVLEYNNAEINCMKFFPVVGWNAYAQWERLKTNDLVIGLTKTNGIESEGVVEYYISPPLGGALIQKTSIDGFGKIIDITFRERG